MQNPNPPSGSPSGILKSINVFVSPKCCTLPNCPSNPHPSSSQNTHAAIIVSLIVCQHRRFSHGQLAGMCSERLKDNKMQQRKTQGPAPTIRSLSFKCLHTRNCNQCHPSLWPRRGLFMWITCSLKLKFLLFLMEIPFDLPERNRKQS